MDNLLVNPQDTGTKTTKYSVVWAYRVIDTDDEELGNDTRGDDCFLSLEKALKKAKESNDAETHEECRTHRVRREEVLTDGRQRYLFIEGDKMEFFTDVKLP